MSMTTGLYRTCKRCGFEIEIDRADVRSGAWRTKECPVCQPSRRPIELLTTDQLLARADAEPDTPGGSEEFRDVRHGY